MLCQTIPIAVLKIAVKIPRNQMDRLTGLQITDKTEHIRPIYQWDFNHAY